MDDCKCTPFIYKISDMCDNCRADAEKYMDKKQDCDLLSLVTLFNDFLEEENNDG